MHYASWQNFGRTNLVSGRKCNSEFANSSRLTLRKGRCCRAHPATASDLALNSKPYHPAPYAKLKVLPRIQYSDNIKDLDHVELLRLLHSTSPQAPTSDQPQSQISSEEALAQLEAAVAHSVSIVVAFVMEDKLSSYQAAMQEEQDQAADDWSWVTARRQKKKRKVLAGFARAVGDGVLVATVHDVVVLPELQGLGLGRKLLAKITSQVLNRTGTDDIGLTSSQSTFGFFNSCGFDLDREQSTYMALTSRSGQTPATDQLQASARLLTLLATSR